MDKRKEIEHALAQRIETTSCRFTQYRRDRTRKLPVATGVVIPKYTVQNTRTGNMRNHLLHSDPYYSSAQFPATTLIHEQSWPLRREEHSSFSQEHSHGQSRARLSAEKRLMLEMEMCDMNHRDMQSWSEGEYDELVEKRHNLRVRPMHLTGRMERILSRARRDAEQLKQFESLSRAKRELRLMLERVVDKARKIVVDDKQLLSWLCTAMHRQPITRDFDGYLRSHNTSPRHYRDNSRNYLESRMHVHASNDGHGGTFLVPIQVRDPRKPIDVIDLSGQSSTVANVATRDGAAGSASPAPSSSPLVSSVATESRSKVLDKIRDSSRPDGQTPGKQKGKNEGENSNNKNDGLRPRPRRCLLCSLQFDSKQDLADHCARSKCSGRLRTVVDALCEAALQKRKQERSKKRPRDCSDQDQQKNHPEGEHIRRPSQKKQNPRKRRSKRLHSTSEIVRNEPRPPSPRTSRVKPKECPKMTRHSKRLRSISYKSTSEPLRSNGRSPLSAADKITKVPTRLSMRLRSCVGNNNVNKISSRGNKNDYKVLPLTSQVDDDDVDGFIIRATVAR